MTDDFVQLPLYASQVPDTGWRPPRISDLPQWPEHGRVSFDLEARDDELHRLGPGWRREAYIVGYSFAIEDGPAYYVPIRHAGGDNVENPEAALQYIRDQADRFKGELAGAGLQYDLDGAEQSGIRFRPKRHLDIQVADPLIYELHDSYSLESISERRGMGGKDEAVLRDAASAWGIDPKKGLWKLPARFVGQYGIGDVRQPLAILRKQEREIEEKELQGVFDLECRLLPVLVKMRRRGVRIDFDRLAQIETLTGKAAAEACAEIARLTGRRLSPDNVMAPTVVGPILESIGVTLDLNSLGKPTIDKEVLDKMDHPVAKALSRARRMRKVQTTYIKSIREHAVNGRIHSTFNQLRGSSAYGRDDGESGARFGRMSSTDPNYQNQPIRDEEIGKLWRSISLPEEGELWAKSDFSQQEPRVLTHFAEVTRCTKAAEFAQKYRDDADMDTYDGLGEMTKVPRQQNKILYLGLSYSMGGAKLCHGLKLPTRWVPDQRTGQMREMAGPEGEAIFNAFHTGAPFVRELNYKVQDRINQRGYIRTLSGRRCHFVPVPPERRRHARDLYEQAHKGLNKLVQGSSADQGKMALVLSDEAGFHLLLQVHDEQDASVKSPEVGMKMGEVMRDAVKLTVPMKVDVSIGANWGDLE